jgi:hypothetical protein
MLVFFHYNYKLVLRGRYCYLKIFKKKVTKVLNIFSFFQEKGPGTKERHILTYLQYLKNHLQYSTVCSNIAAQKAKSKFI